MSQTFNYRKRFNINFFYPLAVFAAAAILFKVTEYGIGLKNLTLLLYPNTYYLSLFLAVLGAAYFIYKYLDYKKSSAKKSTVTLTSSVLSFPYGNDLISVDFNEIDELCNHNEKDDEQVFIYTNNKMTCYELNSEYFDSITEFYSFQKIINTNCINTTYKD